MTSTITETRETAMPQPLSLSPLTMARLDHAVAAKRIRRYTLAKTFVGLTLNDGTILKVTSEPMAVAVVRAMASASHAGLSPREANAAERLSFGSALADDTEGHNT